MKVKMVAFILLAILLSLGVTPVYADTAPGLPHAFYGTVDINGSPAPVGTQVEARGAGVETGVGNNPIEVTVAGEYGGGANPLEPKLIVQGAIAEGATITFYVNGVSTDQTAEWHSGGVSELNIDATIDGALPGDANDDGSVNALDITKVERIIAGVDAQTAGADANQDGMVNSLDITKTERIVAGLD